jgi:NAD(P)H dehydrogenase (quinone)
MIIVTGVSGHLGRLIVEELLLRVPARDIGVSTRNPDQLQKLVARGVRAREADFSDRASLDRAFSGATQVLIISSNAGGRGEDPVAQHRAAIEAAKGAGAKRVLYTSHMGANSQSKFPPMRTHAATEELLAQAGIPFTALRNGFYAQSALQMLGDMTQSQEIAAPQDGPVCWTTHADLAAAAAIILTNEGRFEGATPPLTARATLDLSELGVIVSDLRKVPVTRRVISDEDFHDRLIANGWRAARRWCLSRGCT